MTAEVCGFCDATTDMPRAPLRRSGTTNPRVVYHLICSLRSDVSDKYRPICSLKDNPSTGGGNPGSRAGKGPTSRGGGKGKPVNLCGPVSKALSGADIVSGPVIVVTTTPDGGSRPGTGPSRAKIGCCLRGRTGSDGRIEERSLI